VPEALLFDRGTNLLSHLIRDVCQLLELNTTAHHPQGNERLNRTLESMLHKHAVRFGMQWDEFLPGVLWAYRNMPHESTGEKPSFLLFGFDLRSPSQAALFPSLSQLQWKIIETNQSSVYLQARNWQPLPSSDETGRNRKLSQPWHGPYRVLQTTDTTLTLEKVYHTKQEQLHVHQDRVKFCPPDLPPGYILLVWLTTLFPG
jgi:hypothetical protein